MNQSMRNVALSLCALAIVSCKNQQNKSFLCVEDSDCRKNGSTDKCEAVSGLCVPYYANPDFPDGRSQFKGTGKGTGGVRGAFDCAVNWDSDFKPLQQQSDAFRSAKKQGLATVFLTSPRPVETCGDVQLRNQSGSDKVQLLEGLKTGCAIRVRARPRRDKDGIGSRGKVIEIGFSQFSESPDVPVSAFRIDFRPDWIEEFSALGMGQTISLSPSIFEDGSLIKEGDVTARYFELCDDDDYAPKDGAGSGEQISSSLRLRFIGTDGELVLSEYTPESTNANGDVVPGRLRGFFDFKLVETQNRMAKNAGEICQIPTTCDDANGCLDNEIITPSCFASECMPLLRSSEDQKGQGVCGGRCRDAQDCGYHPENNPSAYCLLLPGKNADDGQCIQVCSTDLMNNVCSKNTVCRPGTDFQSEFGGEGGPARCLDRCIPSASHEVPSDCASNMTRPDGGTMMSPADGGTTPSRDAGTMSPADGGTTPSRDAGTMSSADAGMMNANPLGTSCGIMKACPMGWLCAVQPGVSVDSNTVGYCSKVCMSDSECAVDYSGPGQPTCAPPAKLISPTGAMMIRSRTCGILCGSGLVGPGVVAEMCPDQMQCNDIVDNSNPTQFMMPTLDSINDYCTE